MKRKERQYDIERRASTLKKLNKGLDTLQKRKRHNPELGSITKYQLHNLTKVPYKTINKYPEILDRLNEERPALKLKLANIKINKISTLDEAKFVIEELNRMYNEAVKKAHEFEQINTKLNLDKVKLMKEVRELNNEVKRCRDILEIRV